MPPITWSPNQCERASMVPTTRAGKPSDELVTVRAVRAMSSSCKFHHGTIIVGDDGRDRPIICSGLERDYFTGEWYADENAFLYGLVRYRLPDTFVVRFDSHDEPTPS